jgi:asparagine synthase (glutamine-hydrolysing)
MCGIFGIVNYQETYKKLEKNFVKGQSRGPEFSVLNSYNNIFLGFHRLAINGLNEKSNQPFEIDNIVLICNGEIYNYKELALENNITLTTDSDCEIILHLYKLYGIEYTLNILDGVFAFIIYDKIKDIIITARDPYGVRPLYYFVERSTVSFASELKVLYNLTYDKKNIFNFLPGNYMVIKNHSKILKYNYKQYTAFPCINNEYYNLNELNHLIVDYITSAVRKRVTGTTERPIACLLSGGLDSSLIAALVNREFKLDTTNTNPGKKLKTFSIGLQGSEDLKYAAIVAKHLDTDHSEIIVSEDDFFNAIPDVIKTIESYDTTTVRASVGNYLIGKYIRENSDCKVIFNGDGADELMGGYLYMKKAGNPHEFDKETRRLMQDIYMFDVLRSDKCIASHGLEPRTPFLDRKWVEFYLSIDRNLRYNTTKNNCEKYLIRKAIWEVTPELLPEEILWRKKEAFSDGVSSLQKSWFEIIQEKISALCYSQDNRVSCDSDKFLEYNLINLEKTYRYLGISPNIPTTMEQTYYRYLYNKEYQGTDHLIEYYWMPKYVNAKDASARTLSVYDEDTKDK